MKKNKVIYLVCFAVLCFAYACKKNDGITNQPYTSYGNEANKSRLKVNLAFAYTVDYSNIMIKINNVPVSNLLQTRTPFPGGGYNTRGSNFALYLSVPIGTNQLSVVLPKAGTTSDSVVLFNGTVTTADTAAYTIHLCDTAANMKTVTVKNIITNVDTGFCRFRFINMIPNVPAVDLYLNGVLIRSNLAYLTPSDTFSIRTGVNQPGYVAGTTTPTFAVRPAGAAATSTALASYASTSVLQSQMVMTIYTMGYSGSTGTRLPFVSLTLDKNQ